MNSHKVLAENYKKSGDQYSKIGKFDNAIAEFRKAIEINQEYVSAYYSRGNAYFAKKVFDQAIADYSKAIELSPLDVKHRDRIYNNRGVAYAFKGEFDQAITDFSEAIALNPKDASTYLNRGKAYRDKRKFDQAIADLSEAIKLNSKDAIAYSNRGESYYAKGEFDLAIADSSEAIKLNPKDAAAYFNRGSAYRAKDQNDKAFIDYRKIIELYQINSQSVAPHILKPTIDQLTHGFNYQTKNLDRLDEKTISQTIEAGIKKYSSIPHDSVMEKSFLWCASKKGDTQKRYGSIYVFGTVHYLIGDNVMDRFVDNGVIPYLVSAVPVVFTEMSKDTNPVNIIQKGKPMDGDIFLLDQIFRVEAAKQMKTLKPLENPEIRRLCGNVSPQLNVVLQNIRNNTNNYKNLTTNYLTNIDCNSPAPESSIKREYFWMLKRILPASKSGKDIGVVAGNIHKLRILRLLAAEGYTLKPLMLQAPTPKSEIVRFLYYGNDKFNFFKPCTNRNDERTGAQSKQQLLISYGNQI
jgi:tetratricopeptide (TPR) repeat protein